MKLKISLSKYNGHQAMPCIENTNEDCIELTGPIALPKTACARAAKVLRDAADRFDLLALEERPFYGGTHRRINAMNLPAQPDEE